MTGGILSDFHVQNARPIIENSCMRPPPTGTNVQLKPSTRAKRDSIALSPDTRELTPFGNQRGTHLYARRVTPHRSDVIGELKACVVTRPVIGGYVIGRGLTY